MDVEINERWNRILKIQEDLDTIINEIKLDLEKNRIIREEWYLQKKEWIKNYKNNFTIDNYKK
ncbi:MAG: hypothetical protein KatS3mg129_3167 [Leptospiraceae bacterium]|nr:MAG: hypothetical protein KatS3mg129_3167 [Leptospiraceae bacterium]